VRKLVIAVVVVGLVPLLVYALAAQLVVPANRIDRDAAERESGMVTPAPSDPVAVRMTDKPNRVLLIRADGSTVELPLLQASGDVIPEE
jgi:hypothetical protein